MFIPREFIRRLVDDADIVSIVGERVALTKRGRNHTGLCPFHGEKTPSFSVHSEKGFYHCFGCGAHGSALDFIVHHNGGDFVAGVEELAKIQGVPIPREKGEHQTDSAFGESLQAALQHFRHNLKQNSKAQEYLKGRGVDGKTAAAFQLGYAENAWDNLTGALQQKYDSKTLLAAGLVREKDGRCYDYFRDRIIFPVFDRRGRLCGFGGRALDNAEPAKYLNSPESPIFAKRLLLYGAQTAAQFARSKKRLIIAEGYMDVVRLAQEGFGESVAMMGTAATMQQMGAAFRLANNVVFAFDGDEAGKRAAVRALDGVLPSMRDGDSARFLFLPDGEDPDSYIAKNGADSFEKCINSAISMGDFIEKHLWDGSGEDEGKTSAALANGAKLVRMINMEKAPFLRALLEKRLTARAGLSPAKMRPATRPQQPKGNRAAYRMRPENKLFNLLCCLHVKPDLCRKLQTMPPLLGYDAVAVEMLAIVLRRLWGSEDDNDGQTVAGILHEEGFVKFSAQICDSAPRRFDAESKSAEKGIKLSVGEEFDSIIANLQRKHDELISEKKLTEKLKALRK